MIVFGHSGQVATELRTLLPQATFLSRSDVDLTDPARSYEAITRAAPSAVINAAAYTAVDKAEEDAETAMRVNGDAPTSMARACAELGIPFVNISTDYVFDGTGSAPFAPDHPTGPLGQYGRSKLAGETGVAAAGGAFVNLRTSWVFSAHGNNFLKTMLRLGSSRDALTIVADQIGGPTPARAIAQACVKIAEQLKTAPEKSGIYHFSGQPDVSWAGFARFIFEVAEIDCSVTDIPTSDYPTPAARPLNSRLDCTRTESVFGIERPDWQEAVRTTIAELHFKEST